MGDLETILRLVAEGHLTPDEAAPIIAALTAPPSRGEGPQPAPTPPPPTSARPARHVRIKVSEKGRQVVNLRIPLAFADMAARMVPGLSGEQSERIRAAIDAGVSGPILDVEDPDGDGVLITVE
jgi:hypothetical protein